MTAATAPAQARPAARGESTGVSQGGWFVRITVLVIVLLWTIPTLGVLITSFRPEALVRRNLDRTMDGRYRLQDAPNQVTASLMQPHSRGLAWQHLKARWPEMTEKFPRFIFQWVWLGVTELSRPEWEAEVREYVTRIKLDLGGKIVQQYLERLHVGVLMYQRETPALRDYLVSRFGPE